MTAIKLPKHPRFVNLTGKKFNRYLVLHLVKSSNEGFKWLCRCECGTEKEVFGCSLKNGTTKSCGCFKIEFNKRIRKVHKKSNPLEYNSWVGLKSRCLNISDRAYKDYGGRGITVCDRWLGADGLQNFINDMGKRPNANYSIDRINNNGNYEPSNCRWATAKEQSRNNRNTCIIEYKEKKFALIDLAILFNVQYNTLRHRIIRGWDLEKALTTPSQRKKIPSCY